MSVKIEKAEVNGFTMEYFRFGSGNIPLVIIPGLSVQSVMNAAEAVEAEYDCMKEDFTVYVFDRRAVIHAGYSVRDMARDTYDVIRALGINGFCLFGASQGGMISMAMALDHPESVRKLALASTAARVESTETVERWIRSAKEKDALSLYTEFCKAVYPPAAFGSFAAALPAAASAVTEYELERFAVLAGAVKGFDVLDELPALRCPVLLTGSSDDAVLGAESAYAIADKLKNKKDFELHIYCGYGHAVYDTAPDHRERLREFFLRSVEK